MKSKKDEIWSALKKLSGQTKREEVAKADRVQSLIAEIRAKRPDPYEKIQRVIFLATDVELVALQETLVVMEEVLPPAGLRLLEGLRLLNNNE